jgi:hypothetical protein
MEVIIGTTEKVTNVVMKTLEAKPRKHSTDSLQNTAALAVSHIIRKVLPCETLSLSGGNNRCLKRNTCDKRQQYDDDDVDDNNNY